MGQKTNPNIFRLGVNQTWKTEFVEKKSAELPLYTFKDLEIKDYVERFFEVHGILLHDYKQQYGNSTLNLYISYFVTSDFSVNKEQSLAITMIDKSGNRKVVNLKQNAKNPTFSRFNANNFKHAHKVQEYYAFKKYFESTNLKNGLSTKINTFQTIESGYILKASHHSNVLSKMFKTLSLFVKNEVRININFCCINKDLSFLKSTQKKNFILLQKFRNTLFLKEGMELLFYVVCNTNSASLLTKFIALQIKKIKRQKFFLSFLKQSLTIMLNSTISKAKGIKITLKGRLNGVPRAKHKTIVIGDVPVQSISERIDYSQTTVHNSNGSYGVKVWIVEK